MNIQKRKTPSSSWFMVIAVLLVYNPFWSCKKKTETTVVQQTETPAEKIAAYLYRPPGKFDSYYYWRRQGQAFFSNNGKEELRKLKNEMYARHGRSFDDTVLQRHFEEMPWYNRNPSYNDSLLFPMEVEYVNYIIRTEKILNEMPEDFRARYKKEVSFRMRDNVDTTLTFLRDYTGDGKVETQYTRIFKDDLQIIVINSIVSGRDTLFSKIDTASFSPEFSEYAELSTDYKLVLEYASHAAEMKGTFVWSDFIFGMLAKEISRETGKDPKGFIDEMKQYVHEFEGSLFNTTISEAAGCGYIWYSPIDKFVIFYCP